MQLGGLVPVLVLGVPPRCKAKQAQSITKVPSVDKTKGMFLFMDKNVGLCLYICSIGFSYVADQLCVFIFVSAKYYFLLERT